jgi:ribosomal protein L30/L7E
MIAVIRIVGQCKLKGKTVETLNRLKLRRKFTCILVDEKDEIRMGMVRAVEDSVAYGVVDDKFVKEMKEKRGKEGKDVFFLHPPVGGFKKSSKVAAPKGILRKHEDISKLLGRML